MGKADKLGKWIPVDASTFIRESRVVEPKPSANEGSFVKGTVAVSLSPYDVPEAVRAHVDDSNGAVVIDLRYFTSEPTVEVRKDSVTLMRGSGSGRIYQIKVLAPNAWATEMDVPNAIRGALKKLEADADPGFGPRERIKVVENVITGQAESLFGMPVAGMHPGTLGMVPTLFAPGSDAWLQSAIAGSPAGFMQPSQTQTQESSGKASDERPPDQPLIVTQVLCGAAQSGSALNAIAHTKILLGEDSPWNS